MKTKEQPMQPFPHIEEFLDNPAVVSLQRLFVRFDDVNSN